MADETIEVEVSLSEQLGAVEWWRWLLILGLIMLSGCFSGLNLGVLGLDTKDLELMTEGPYESKEEEQQGAHARKLIPLRRRGNLLLCSILLGNVMVNSLLSILMSDIAGGAVALIASTTLIVIFGEIVPQAICSRHGVKAGAYLSWLLWITIVVTFIFAYPIAAILDKVLGEEVGAVMSKTKMKKFFEIQQDMKMIEDQEGKILRATLELSNKAISQVMVPIEDIFSLDINTVIDREVSQVIYTKGFSRIPIYDGEPSNIVGVLMAKDLILFSPDRDKITIRQLSSVLREIVHINHTTTCLQVLSCFKEGGTHLAIVTKVQTEDDDDNPAGSKYNTHVDPYNLKKIGLITLEDIIEEIIDAEIEDEYEGDGKEERRIQKEQLLALFMTRMAGKNLEENELKAVQHFLSSYLDPFKEDKLRESVLEALVCNSEILNIESDSRPFTHKTDVDALFQKDTKVHKELNRVGQLLNKTDQNEQKAGYSLMQQPVSTARTQGEAIGLINEQITENNDFDDDIVVANENNMSDSKKQVQQIDTEAGLVPLVQDPPYVFNPILYTRGIEADAFYLILSGKVMVCSGNEGFMITQSSFNYLGVEALTRKDYKPDFSAKVIEQARILRISRAQYQHAITSLQQNRGEIRQSAGVKKPYAKTFGATKANISQE